METLPKKSKEEVAEPKAVPQIQEAPTFAYSLEGSVKERYRTWQYCEHERYNSTTVLPKYDRTNCDQVDLLVGDYLVLKSQVDATTKKVRCFDFKRNTIITGIGLFEYVDVEALNVGRVHRERDNNLIKITCANQVWIKRYPLRTHQAYQMEIQRVKDRRNAYINAIDAEDKSQDKTDEMGDSEVRFSNFLEMNVTKENKQKWESILVPPCEGLPSQEEDIAFRRLIDLPHEKRSFIANKHQSETFIVQGNERVCFICGENVKVTAAFSEGAWADVKGVKNVQSYKHLMQHCQQFHPGQVFHFLIKSDWMRGLNYCFDVKQQSQRLLRNSLQDLCVTVPLRAFVTNKENRCSQDLLSYLNLIMGGALMSANSKIEETLLAKRQIVKDTKAWSNHAHKIFAERVKGTLEEIFSRLNNFDWVVLGELVTAYQLWNATNLFFKRGLFDETFFPPVYGLMIPDFNVHDAIKESQKIEESISF
jgi:hypothetical protein